MVVEHFGFFPASFPEIYAFPNSPLSVMPLMVLSTNQLRFLLSGLSLVPLHSTLLLLRHFPFPLTTVSHLVLALKSPLGNTLSGCPQTSRPRQCCTHHPYNVSELASILCRLFCFLLRLSTFLVSRELPKISPILQPGRLSYPFDSPNICYLKIGRNHCLRRNALIFSNVEG